jgi:fructokinase
MPDTPVLAIGELLWDLLPSGPRLGGAPFNAVAHMARLNHVAAILSAVGDDELGRRTRSEVKRLGVRADVLQMVTDAPTGTVEVTLDEHGRPSYVIVTPVAYEYAAASATILESVRSMAPRAVLFGTLAQRSPVVRATTAAVLDAVPDALAVYDVNLREGCWTPALVDDLARSASVLKLNEDELAVLGPALDLAHSDFDTFAGDVIRRYPRVQVVCITRGGRGAFIWTRRSWVDFPGVEIRVADTVGAGDAFTAGLVHGLLANMNLADTGRLASALGAIVASRPGAVPGWIEDDIEILAPRAESLRLGTPSSLASAATPGRADPG